MYQCFVRNEYEMAQGIAELRLGGESLFAYRFYVHAADREDEGKEENSLKNRSARFVSFRGAISFERGIYSRLPV